MQPKSETAWEDAVTDTAKRAALAWLYFVGCHCRSMDTAVKAEAAGITGASRLLPSLVPAIDMKDTSFLQTLREPVARGIVSEAEAERALSGKI